MGKWKGAMIKCFECGKRSKEVVPSVLWAMLATAGLSWAFGGAYVTLALVGAIVVLYLLDHMSRTEE